MKRIRSASVRTLPLHSRLVIPIIVLNLWPSTQGHASWAPLQTVEAWTESVAEKPTVRWKVYDPVLQQWQTGGGNRHDEINRVLVQDGVVAYQYGDSFGGAWKYAVEWVVYDPPSQQWYAQRGNGHDTIDSLIVKDGVVGYRYGDSLGGDWKYAAEWAVYDPHLVQWQTGISGFHDAIGSLTVQDGVIAYQYGDSLGGWNYTVEWSLYDPQRSEWKRGVSNRHNVISSLSIANATVTYVGDGISRTLGYDHATQSWYSGPTKPLAYFSARPSSGNPPLRVWFVDMSIGTTTWSWNFGDGANSNERSPDHTFTGAGVFTVTQSAAGPQGSSSASTNIVTDLVPPTGSIAINGGTGHTATRSVTLTISASDNSGSVASMQFSSDGANWGGWEAFSASKSWTLPSGDGAKNVYAQFRDDAGNVSANISATIVLDSTAPSGSITINNGAATTSSAAVTLTLAASDGGSGVAQMRLSHDGATWNQWESFAASKAWTLLPGEGERTAFVQFKDAVGNASSSFSAAILVRIETTPGALTWNLAEDFRVAPNQENPIRDRYNNGVWYLFQSASSTRNGDYTLFDPATGFSTTLLGANTSTFFTPGAQYGIPFVGKNHSGGTLSNFFPGNTTVNWPNGTILAHPGFTSHIIVGWKSPITGTVSISGEVTDQDHAAGNGVAWFIDKNSSASDPGNLASGSINNGGAQRFSAGAGGSGLANVTVAAGDFIYFVVDRNGDVSYDSTRLEVIVQSLTQTGGNSAPAMPTNTSPADGATVQSLTLTLQSSAFSDPDGDTHGASQWQVLDSAGTSVVWDSGEDAANQTSRSVPSGVLAYATTYRWHVRYRDSRGTWSSYSRQTAFTTAPDPTPGALTWNLAEDFRIAPNQENPIRDRYHNTVWYLLTGSTRDGNYTLFDPATQFSSAYMGENTSTFYTPGAAYGIPFIGKNHSGNDLIDISTRIYWPNGTILTHPGFTSHVIVGWKSPISGAVSISGGVTDQDNGGGNGVAWFIDKNSSASSLGNLASGSINDGGAQVFGAGTGGSGLANVAVAAGDFIYFVVDRNGDVSDDSTRLEVVIQALAQIGGNSPPATPGNSSPANGAADQSLTLNLQSSAFSDPDGDTHAASQWQVLDSAGMSVVWDSGEDTANKTSRGVPTGALAYSTTYRWQVRHKDNRDAWSAYSAATSFTTANAPNNPPATPSNTSPVSGATGQALALTLQSSAFSDPDGDTHAASQWRVLDSSGSSVVWDSGEDTANKTSHSVPSGVLAFSTTYRWQVRYKDSRGVWSSFSQPTAFTTRNNAPYIAYFTDFEQGIGPEWSSATSDNTYPGTFTEFTGRFGNTTQTLTLNNLAAGQSHDLEFDLYVIDSWDGTPENNAFQIDIDGVQVFRETFYNSPNPGPELQSFRGTPVSGWVPLGFAGFIDAIYRDIKITFTPGNSTAQITFSAQNLQPLWDESWGIDNVSVASETATTSLPTTPGNTSPLDGAIGQSLTLTLQSSAFSDPDGDTHAASQWQVLDSSGSSVVWDSGEDSANKTSRTVPSGALAYSTTYRWHVRHKDSRGAWSATSSSTSFTTASAPVTY